MTIVSDVEGQTRPDLCQYRMALTEAGGASDVVRVTYICDEPGDWGGSCRSCEILAK